MAASPSLFSLVFEAIDRDIMCGDVVLPQVYELPSYLFGLLIDSLSPMSLEKLQSNFPSGVINEYETSGYFLKMGRKRGRNDNFNEAWKNLFILRWPSLTFTSQPVDWLQIYWETHVQNCIDEVAELALVPSFHGEIGEIKVSDMVLKFVGCQGQRTHLSCDYSKLSYHCERFGFYIRNLKLPSVLCVAASCQLLRNSRLEVLVLHWIRRKEHVNGLCKLLIQNSESLTSIEFSHCSISSTFVDAICSSLHRRNDKTHGILHFSISTSTFLEPFPDSLSPGFVGFLSSGRSMCSLKICDSNLNPSAAQTALSTLLNASSCLSILDLSENNLAGWLSNFLGRSSNSVQLISRTCKHLQSLQVLNLRRSNLNNSDAECLRYLLSLMPNLEILDISQNPIGDDGIRFLIPYFVETSAEGRSLFTELNLESCELSCDGVAQLLDMFSTLELPLTSLSLADNYLGSQVARPLGNFLQTSIKMLNIGGIGLGASGFCQLEEQITKDLKLAKLDISKNRGRIETAGFLSKLFSLAPELVSVNASYNLMPIESSLAIISGELKESKGKLECVDLRGNGWANQQGDACIFTDFQRNGKPILILPLLQCSNVPYDDDP